MDIIKFDDFMSEKKSELLSDCCKSAMTSTPEGKHTCDKCNKECMGIKPIKENVKFVGFMLQKAFIEQILPHFESSAAKDTLIGITANHNSNTLIAFTQNKKSKMYGCITYKYDTTSKKMLPIIDSMVQPIEKVKDNIKIYDKSEEGGE